MRSEGEIREVKALHLFLALSKLSQSTMGRQVARTIVQSSINGHNVRRIFEYEWGFECLETMLLAEQRFSH